MYVTSRVGIVALMVVGSVALWIGSPLFWMWLTSKLQEGTQASMGPYAVMLTGFIATSVALGKGLSILNRGYARAAGSATVHVHLPWHRIRGGEHERHLTPVTVLDVVMVISVITAALALVIWFFVVEPVPPGLPGGPGGSKD